MYVIRTWKGSLFHGEHEMLDTILIYGKLNFFSVFGLHRCKNLYRHGDNIVYTTEENWISP